MRRLGLLTPVSLGLLAFACTRDNPAFDDCETDAACVDESGTRGDGDGDPGDGDPGDGDPGDGDPGDGDPGDGDPGDGDGDAGDGDGDGDGDPLLPTCPDTTWVSMPVVQDTFLDGSPAANGNPCLIDWDFAMNQPVFGNALCPGLDFGGSPAHWACAGDGCNSVWLGEFALSEWMEFPVQVEEAVFEFTAKYKNGEANSVLAYELAVDGVNFGDCLDWHAGLGLGDPPGACATTFVHSAYPNTWPNGQLLQGGVIAAANLPPSGDQYIEETFYMPIDPVRVQGWLDGDAEQHGVIVTSSAWAPTELYLFAQGSGEDPLLKARLCLP